MIDGANGAGWAASIGKIGSIAGPYLGGVVLSSRLPVRFTYALLAICPCLVGVTAFIIGPLQRRLAQTEEATQRPEPLAPIASQAETSG